MSRIKNSLVLFIALFLLYGVILLPISTFPMSMDHSIYSQAGAAIAQGKLLYKEFIDVKSPIWYYYFACINIVFGSGEFAIRWADIIVTAILFSWITLRYKSFLTLTELVCISVIYLLAYIAPGFGVVMQPDSFINPLLMLIILSYSKQYQTKVDVIERGVLIGFIVGIKLTFAVILPVALLLELIESKQNRTQQITYTGLMIMSIVTGLALSYSPLLNSEIRESYLPVMKFTAQYAAFPPFTIVDFFKSTVKAQTDILTDNYSLPFMFCALVGFVLALRQSVGTTWNNITARNKVVLIALMYGLALWCSIIIERKFLPNHFYRIYGMLSIASGVTVALILQWVKTLQWNKNNILISGLVCSTVVLFISLSPVSRYVVHVMNFITYHSNQQKFDTVYERSEIGYDRVQEKQIAAYINSHSEPTHKTLVIGNGISQTYIHVHKPVWSYFGEAHFYHSSYAPPIWVNRYHQEITMAHWIVVCTNDVYPFLNGHDRTSWQSLQQDSAIYPYFTKHFRAVLPLRSMTLYQRIEPDSTQHIP